MLPALVALGTLLLVALITIAVLLAGLGASAVPADETESAPVIATPTPTPTPTVAAEPEDSAEPAPEPAPPAPAPPAPPAPPSNPKPTFTSFSPKNGFDVGCADEYDSRDVSFSWNAAHADRAWIGISTPNAQAAPYAEVPVSGSYTITFQCSEASEIYTVTAVGSHGTTHHTVRLYR